MWNKAHQGFSPQSAFDELKMSPRVTRMKSSFLSSLLFSIRCFRFSSTLSFFPSSPSSLLASSIKGAKNLPSSGKRGIVPSRLRTGINLGHWQSVGRKQKFTELNLDGLEKYLLRRKWFEGFFFDLSRLRTIFERMRTTLSVLSLSPDEKPLNTNLINDKPRPVGLISRISVPDPSFDHRYSSSFCTARGAKWVVSGLTAKQTRIPLW